MLSGNSCFRYWLSAQVCLSVGACGNPPWSPGSQWECSTARLSAQQQQLALGLRAACLWWSVQAPKQKSTRQSECEESLCSLKGRIGGPPTGAEEKGETKTAGCHFKYIIPGFDFVWVAGTRTEGWMCIWANTNNRLWIYPTVLSYVAGYVWVICCYKWWGWNSQEGCVEREDPRWVQHKEARIREFAFDLFFLGSFLVNAMGAIRCDLKQQSDLFSSMKLNLTVCLWVDNIPVVSHKNGEDSYRFTVGFLWYQNKTNFSRTFSTINVTFIL